MSSIWLRSSFAIAGAGAGAGACAGAAKAGTASVMAERLQTVARMKLEIDICLVLTVNAVGLL